MNVKKTRAENLRRKNRTVSKDYYLNSFLLIYDMHYAQFDLLPWSLKKPIWHNERTCKGVCRTQTEKNYLTKFWYMYLYVHCTLYIAPFPYVLYAGNCKNKEKNIKIRFPKQDHKLLLFWVICLNCVHQKFCSPYSFDTKSNEMYF